MDSINRARVERSSWVLTSLSQGWDSMKMTHWCFNRQWWTLKLLITSHICSSRCNLHNQLTLSNGWSSGSFLIRARSAFGIRCRTSKMRNKLIHPINWTWDNRYIRVSQVGKHRPSWTICSAKYTGELKRVVVAVKITRQLQLSIGWESSRGKKSSKRNKWGKVRTTSRALGTATLQRLRPCMVKPKWRWLTD